MLQVNILQILEVTIERCIKWIRELAKRKYKWSIIKKRYFVACLQVNTSFIFPDFCWNEVCSNYTWNKLLQIIFHKVVTLAVKISQCILEVYFIFRVQKSIWSYSSISAGENTSRGINDLWSNSLEVRVQVYQSTYPIFKTISWLKNYISLSSCKHKYPEKEKKVWYWNFVHKWSIR